MIINGLRWGSSRPEDEAYAAGVRIAHDYCELTVWDDEKLIYLTVTGYYNFHEVRISDHPVFEQLLSLDGCEDYEDRLKEIDSDLLEHEIFEDYKVMGDEYSEVSKPYEDAIEISISCMDAYFESDCVGNADEFINSYIGMDTKDARFEIVDGGYQQQMKEAELMAAVNEMAERLTCRLVDVTRRGLRAFSINVASNGRIVVTDEKRETIIDRWLDRGAFKDWQSKEVQ